MELMLPLNQKREAPVKNILLEFSKHFEIIDVNTSELARETFRLRYQTMCVEHGFLSTSAYPDDMERDEYDDRSVSVLIRHTPTKQYVASVRLILQNAATIGRPLPVEKYMKINNNDINFISLPRNQVAEISRFVTLREFSGSNYECFPHISLALCVGVVRMSAKNNVRYWISGMTPGLNRHIRSYGFDLIGAGPIVDYEYYGRRKAYFGDVVNVLKKVRSVDENVWNLATKNGQYCLDGLQSAA
ncbi:MAG: hypothetical protein NMNS01_18550 [Nitrosomonas sp.]|nr:MAG: hypothetical protein NMNS01_18550 [Nitrosomonas sp.]